MSVKHDRDGEIVDNLSRDARSLWAPPSKNAGDRDDAEQKLFARIDAHEAELAKRPAGYDSARLWSGAALITAMAAGLLLFAHGRGVRDLHGPQGQEGASAEANRSQPPSIPAGQTGPAGAAGAGPVNLAAQAEPRAKSSPAAPVELASVTRGGEVRVDGAAVRAHELSLHDSQTVEARGGEAVFAAPGRVDWLFESGTEVSTVRAGARGGAIVFALRVGAVEAQVVPVPAGEAFAVDVDGVRVAVHGTHLRVARAERGGAHVVVDLSEGVISVGAPPKAGSTVGVLVNAPAHVEFSVADLEGTLRVDHDPAHVRAPVDPASLSETASATPSTSPARPRVSSAPPAAVQPAVVAPPVTAPVVGADPKPQDPREVVLASVNRCAEQALHGNSTTLTITSVLNVNVNQDGTVASTVFAPPVGQELQDCVGAVARAQRWNEPGLHQIPIEIHR